MTVAGIGVPHSVMTALALALHTEHEHTVSARIGQAIDGNRDLSLPKRDYAALLAAIERNPAEALEELRAHLGNHIRDGN